MYTRTKKLRYSKKQPRTHNWRRNEAARVDRRKATETSSTHCQMEFIRNDYVDECDPSFPCNVFLGCLTILDLLGLCVCWRKRALIKACVQVSSHRQWADLFMAGHLVRARDYLLHVAIKIAADSQNWTLFNTLLPEINSFELLICAYLNAVEVCKSKSKHATSEPCNTEADHRRSVRRVFIAALRSCHWFVVKACLNNRVDVQHACAEARLDLKGPSGHMILHSATAASQWKVVVSLVLHGADPDTVDSLGFTVLHHAVWSKRWNTTLFLISRCRDPTKVVTSRSFRRAQSLFHIMCQEGQQKLVRACASRGVNLDSVDLSGCTGMFLAARRRDWNMVRLLLELGADPFEGMSVLQEAVTQHNWELAKLIIRHSRHPEKEAANQMHGKWVLHKLNTALHCLCDAGQVELLHTLILMGADPLVQNYHGETLLLRSLFATTNLDSLVRVLIQCGMSTHQAVLSDQVLHRRDATVHDLMVVSPMAMAVWNGMLGIVKVLYASGASFHREMHFLERDPVCRAHLEQKDHADVLAFLREVSVLPRSLRDLCALKISHVIGCRPGREERVAHLGLPRRICDLVLMNHVTSSEFTVEYRAQRPNPQSYTIDLLGQYLQSFTRSFTGIVYSDIINSVLCSPGKLCDFYPDTFYPDTWFNIEPSDKLISYESTFVSADFYAKFGLERDTFRCPATPCSCFMCD